MPDSLLIIALVTIIVVVIGLMFFAKKNCKEIFSETLTHYYFFSKTF